MTGGRKHQTKRALTPEGHEKPVPKAAALLNQAAVEKLGYLLDHPKRCRPVD